MDCRTSTTDLRHLFYLEDLISHHPISMPFLGMLVLRLINTIPNKYYAVNENRGNILS